MTALTLVAVRVPPLSTWTRQERVVLTAWPFCAARRRISPTDALPVTRHMAKDSASHLVKPTTSGTSTQRRLSVSKHFQTD